MVDKIKIYPWATDTAGCFYQRLKLPLDALERAYPDEFEVCWTCEPKSGDGPAVVLGQRIMGNGAEPDGRWRGFCDDPRIMAVYEIDDDILDIDPENAVPYGIFAPNRAGTLANIAAADHVIASTYALASKIMAESSDHHFAGRVTVALNFIADGSVIERDDWPSTKYRPTIGWAGSMFHQQDFPPRIVGQFDAVAAAHPELHWLSIGANYLGRGSTYGWDRIERYHQRLTHLDIGLAPIRHTPFNRSKSWIKVLDYMSRGVIPVAARWGQYPSMVIGGLDGFLVDDDGDWLETINTILSLDPSRLTAMRRAALSTARRMEISKHVHIWANIFRKARDLA